ncbi:MAG TPA: hypothetical protein VEX65_08815 [Flavisolibacter sp.]|jgi:hypothetical protein|nr:hypothetical protein [Flavisolibacter sp.]
MKKTGTRLLYVFSFSLLFTALYLNVSQKSDSESFLVAEKKTAVSSSVLESSTVAQPENNTVRK